MPVQITEWSNALMASVAGALGLLFSAVPRLLGFVAILLVGWLLASLVRRAVAAVLGHARLNEWSQRAGVAGFVSQMGLRTDSSGLLALLAQWFVRLIALVVAFDALGLPAVADVLRQLLLWLPQAVVALVVLVIGGLAARALSSLVRGAVARSGRGDADLLAKVASAGVWAVAAVVAVHQMGIATALVQTLFMAAVGGLALALGLAFGLGGRDTAAEIVRRWYQRGRDSELHLLDAQGHAAEGPRAGAGRVPGNGGVGGPHGGQAGGAGSGHSVGH